MGYDSVLLGGAVGVYPADGGKCERCWKYHPMGGRGCGPSGRLSPLRGGITIFTAGRKRARIVFLLAVILLFDQGTKLLVDHTIPLHHSVSVIDGLVDLTHVRNKGSRVRVAGRPPASPGFLHPYRLLADCHRLRHPSSPPAFRRGYRAHPVVDVHSGRGSGQSGRPSVLRRGDRFCRRLLARLPLAAFNVADSFITVGAVLCLYCLVRTKGRDPFSPAGSGG